MNPPANHRRNGDENVDITIPTSWLSSLLSARFLLPLGLAAAAGYGGFSARGAVESCPPELKAQLGRMEQRLESLEDRVEGLDRRFDRVDGRLERLSRKLDGIASRQAAGDPLAMTTPNRRP